MRCFRYHKGTDFQANHNPSGIRDSSVFVVLDTTKVQIFKQITTVFLLNVTCVWLFQIPQRYRFSSKSQLFIINTSLKQCCFRYHKGTDFQANHNLVSMVMNSITLFQIPQRYRFSSKSQPYLCMHKSNLSCFRYHKGTDFQANHNEENKHRLSKKVVLDTTKVQIFKQITTKRCYACTDFWLFQIPQRYRFSSKSQRNGVMPAPTFVVLDTTKVQIFKQITTCVLYSPSITCCFRYHKGTDFQANHNSNLQQRNSIHVVLDTTKVQIFKQITTSTRRHNRGRSLFQIPQRYRFSSKSQPKDR